MKACPVCGTEWPEDFRVCPSDGTGLSTSGASDDLTDTVIADRYHVERKIGAGGMGTVYRARHLRTEQPIAVKVISHRLAQDTNAIARFSREARTAATIRHPNVCVVHDFGETAQGQVYLVTEFIEGEPLGQTLEREGTLAAPRIESIVRQCCDALQAAHDLGIVHRDIKPDNIMVMPGRDGDVVKVVDFGLAKAVAAEAGQNVTEAGVVVGTVDYMSPEQAAGDPVDGRSDLYSLALVLFRAITGTLPFPYKPGAAAMLVRMSKDPATLVEANPDIDVAPELQAVMDGALARKPGDRYATVLEFAEAVRNALGVHTGTVTSAVSVPATETGTPSGSTSLERLLADGREAIAHQAWHEARALLGRADEIAALSLPDLEALAEAAWWTGDFDEAADLRGRLFAALRDQGDKETAARIAIQNAETFHYKLAHKVADTWLRRAEKMLEGDTTSAAYGYLLRQRSSSALERGEIEESLKLAQEVMRIAEALNEPDLHAFSLQDQGKALVQMGHTAEGLALLDEAMAAAVAGELSPIVTGKTFCNMLSTCEKVADYDRAGQWDKLASKWCERHSESTFPGICRVYRAKIMRLRGAWDSATEIATRASEELSSFLPMAAEAWYEVGDIRMRLGDLAGADEAFKQAHALGRDPVPGMSDLRLAEGKVDHARALIDAALDEKGSDAVNRARLLPTKIAVSLANDDVPAAREALANLEKTLQEIPSPMLEAVTSEHRGAVQLAEGDTSDAVSTLRTAVRQWTDVGFPFETARARTTLGRAFRAAAGDASAELEFSAAQKTFENLGAVRWAEEAARQLTG